MYYVIGGYKSSCVRIGAERERTGNCLAGLVLVSHESSGDDKQHRYVFGRRQKAGGCPTPLTESGFGDGDYVLLSLDGELIESTSTRQLIAGFICTIALTVSRSVS